MKPRDVIKICQDSREQKGLERDFDGLDCEVIPDVTLPTFDYCLQINGAIDSGFAVERKSVVDFVGSVTTTDGWRREVAKIQRCGFSPVIYVVEGTFEDILPARRCWCYDERASKRCTLCHGNGYPFCVCVSERPNLKCEACHGTGTVGYNYDRRRITPQFVYRRVFELMYHHKVVVLFAGSRVAAACCIEGLLRRRYDVLNLVAKSKCNAQKS